MDKRYYGSVRRQAHWEAFYAFLALCGIITLYVLACLCF